MAARRAIASVASLLEKGRFGGWGIYSAGAIEELNCCCCCCCGGNCGSGGAEGSPGEKVKLPPFSAGTNGALTVAGRTGCTLGVMGLYAGATGDEDPVDFCVLAVSRWGAVGWWCEGGDWTSRVDMCSRGQCVERWCRLREDRHRQKRRSFSCTWVWTICFDFEVFGGGFRLLERCLESWVRSTTFFRSVCCRHARGVEGSMSNTLLPVQDDAYF